MPYKPIEIRRKKITIIKKNHSSIISFEEIVNVLKTVTIKDFNQTPRCNETISDLYTDNITIEHIKQLTKKKAYA